MRWMLTNDSDTPIDEQITIVLGEMSSVGVSSDQYPKYMEYLERLNGIKAKRRRDPVSRDVVAQIFGNLMGILIIVAYEQKNVITSRAFGELIRTNKHS